MVERAAGFWRRLGATAIDWLVLAVIDGVVLFVLGRTAEALLGAVFHLTYFTYFHGTTGQTPGDAALGIRVLDIDTGQVIGYRRALLRSVVSVASGIVLLVGYLSMLWNSRRQTWHDRAARSLPVLVG
jgi:uncharacterized RDD family membrane protein YckC